jgi:hypothetical protein
MLGPLVVCIPAFPKAAIGFGHVGILVGGQLCVGHAKTVRERMVGMGIQLLAKSQGTDLRCILIPHAVGDERLVGNCQRVMERLRSRLTHAESILTKRRCYLKSDILYDD